MNIRNAGLFTAIAVIGAMLTFGIVQAQQVNSIATIPGATLIDPLMKATGTDATINFKLGPKGASGAMRYQADTSGIHAEYNQASVPTVSATGAANVTAKSTDSRFQFQASSAGTAITLTFIQAFNNVPICQFSMIQTQTNGFANVVAVSNIQTTSIVFGILPVSAFVFGSCDGVY